MFPAFSARTTPELLGQVSLVSADALRDERSQMSYYRVEIKVSEEEIAQLEGQSLLPGMPVETFFTTGNRTPIAYLVQPFMDYFARALRES